MLENFKNYCISLYNSAKSPEFIAGAICGCILILLLIALFQ